MSKVVTINVGKDFSKLPFGRYHDDGDFSGQAFREKILEPAFETDAIEIEVQLDDIQPGWEYGSSFLEESFGRLASKIGRESINRLKIVTASPDYELEINSYIDEALT